MDWRDIPLNPKPKMLRQFAGAWLGLFAALSAQQYFQRSHHGLGLALAACGLGVGTLGLCRPASLRWLLVGSMVLAFPMGWLVSQVMLAAMFYGVLTPLAVLFRLLGRDMLNRKRAPRTTLWTTKPAPRDVGSYFRQY